MKIIEEKIPPTAINNNLPEHMPSFAEKTKNAWEMLTGQGFGPFWHKINRLLVHKKQAFIRQLFHPNSGQKLREAAKKHLKDGKKLPTLSVIIPILGMNDMTKLCLSKFISNQVEKIEIVFMNAGENFSLESLDLPKKSINIKIVQDLEPYPAFKFWMENTTGDIMLFMHNDIMIDEYGFDITLRYVFEKNKKLGLVGFIGSDEISGTGSRLWGTTSNFLGKTYNFNGKSWSGTPAFIHGYQYDGLTPAVFIDGCTMALKRSVWNKIGYHVNQSIYYFYDRWVCCQVLEAGYKIATLGIACDHISNQTASKEIKYHKNIHMLCEKYGISPIKDVNDNVNWDITLHAEAKRRFINEWRDEKHFIPRKI